MDESEKQDLKRKLDSLKEEINQLRKDVNILDKAKEELFNKRRSLDSGVRGELNLLSTLKRDRNNLTRQVRELKTKRDPLNKKIRENIEKIKGMKKISDKASEKLVQKDKKGFVKKISPGMLKMEIDKLEFKIETEVFSPKKEQELMKVLKEKKKLYKEVALSGNSWKDMKSLSSEIDNEKSEANEFHSKIQKLAEESQKKHEKIIEISKKVEPIMPELKELDKQIDKAKMEFSVKSNALKEKLMEISKLSQELGVAMQDEEKPRMSREEIHKILESKEKSVEEKIKKRQKLTNEDLLVFQKPTHYEKKRR